MVVSRRHAAGSRRGWVALVIGVVFGLLTATLAAIASLVARTVLVPPTTRDEDTEVLSVDEGSHTITFSRSPDSVVSGRYSFWFDGARGHARVGEIVAETAESVARELLGVDFGDIASARRGRFNGWFYLYPSDLGLEFENVEIDTDLGPAPAWVVPAARVTGSDRWVIQVHGRAVMRAETLRAVPVFRDAGYTSLLISYRNDFEAPASADGRYALGDAEWRDVDAAVRFAVAHGAKSVVLMGWSMGGAAVLQTLTRSSIAHKIAGVVLDSPVIDWRSTLHFQGRERGLPRPLRVFVFAMMSSKWGRPFTGQEVPIDLDRLDFVRRARELAVPILILHSDDDGYVPSDASRSLAAARPDIVTLESFRVARHTKLWNREPDRWTTAIAVWLEALAGP